MLCNSRLSIPRGPPNSQLDVFVSMGPSWATFEHQKRSRTYGEHNRTIVNNQSKNDQNGRWSLDLYSTTVLYRHMWLHRSAHRPSFSTVSGSGCLVMPTPAKAPNPPRSLLRVLSFAASPQPRGEPVTTKRSLRAQETPSCRHRLIWGIRFMEMQDYLWKWHLPFLA